MANTFGILHTTCVIVGSMYQEIEDTYGKSLLMFVVSHPRYKQETCTRPLTQLYF